MTLTERIKQYAVDIGFDFVGIAPATPAPHQEAYNHWLQQGYHADMEWLNRNPDRRASPQAVLPEAQCVITLGVSYFTEDPPPALWNDPSRGRIARYAWGPDYHDILTPMLKQVCTFIRTEVPDSITRYYVDTGPVLEHESAWQGGQGFIGRNTLFIHPQFGSYVFLAEILCSCELELDSPTEQSGAVLDKRAGFGKTASCGSCRRCLDHCPTHAFPAPYILDSRLCLSYLTIESKGPTPDHLRPLCGNWVYGCDACQEVCPWVKQYAKPTTIPFLQFEESTCAPELLDLLSLDDEGFRNRFRKRPVKRTKRRGLLRNVAVALGNWGSVDALPALEIATRDPEPLIREHAIWAKNKILAET